MGLPRKKDPAARPRAADGTHANTPAPALQPAGPSRHGAFLLILYFGHSA